MRRLLAPVPLLLLLAACGGEQAPATPPPPEVGVIEATPANLPLTLDIGGRLAPFRSADVRARVPGVLQKRVYAEGSDVREGDVLFLIDPAPLQAALGTAQASLAQAQANYANAKAGADRARQLAPQNYVSQSDLDNALAAERSAAAAVQAGRAAVDSARINLGYATVRAPIAGIAGKQRVTEGALVGQGDATLLTTVDQVDPLYVNFSISVSELGRIRAIVAASGRDRSEVAVRLPDGSEHAHKGALDFSADLVDPATGAVSMRASVPNPDRRLLPGTYVTLEATMGMQQGVFAIPQAAVQRDASGAYVLVVGADGKVARRDVETSTASEGNWIVTDGLSAGEQVIVAGVQKVRVDAPARAVPWQRDGAAPPAKQAPAPGAPQPAARPAAPVAPSEGAPADADAEG
ncbi:efflux RND transporter periplasmic adaptor subunit [Luteimonas viscosa]|uniref:Efflux RND transporter periplasmic adaptor subunit n=1 Tax=Luteimonas viscosa TaxID=1132694 RepID=A0A5D4XS00_9GAMM|nr:efflux RND transporter periplasmic adaptor subunit [Luteimonas viscosa]TYT26854.1 efflux RND transporter periplasmic adaptor subunit [Luteimonas viscosa]